MQFSRRGFIKLGAGATAALAFSGLGVSLTPVTAAAQDAKLKWTKQTTSVCCYCAVGCGLLVSTSAEGHPDGPGKAINVEGNPDHPINEGSLCAKGASTFQLASNKDRPKKPLYRAPGAMERSGMELGSAGDRQARQGHPRRHFYGEKRGRSGGQPYRGHRLTGFRRSGQ